MNTNQTTKAEELAKPEPCCWASENVIPLRGLKDNHPAILTATKCAANTIPLYREPPAPAVPDEFRRLVHDIDDLIANSGGVSGLHLNGDIAPWSELLAGGRFEEWLMCLDDARAILVAAPQPPAVSDDKRDAMPVIVYLGEGKTGVTAFKHADGEIGVALNQLREGYKFGQEVGQADTVDDLNANVLLVTHNPVGFDVLINALKEAQSFLNDEPGAPDPRDQQIAELRRQVFSYESMVANRDERLANLWRPIDTAPRDGGVIIVRGAQNVSIGWWYGVGLNAWLPHNCEPTHWMPLPPVPAIDGVQEIKK